MSTAKLRYLGDLRTEITHSKSGNSFVTDAPIDNNGKGEAFSPTDLIAAALLTCIVTVMDIAAKARGWEIGNIEATVQKTMVGNPRRVQKLECQISISNNTLSEDQRALLEKIGIECPVAMSLHPEIEQTIDFVYL